MDIILATGNLHKRTEFQRIFPGHRVVIPKELGLSFEHEETGTTFGENALGKALALYAKTGRPVVADDSGLCVTALDGAPGIRSARYGSQGGVNLAAAERNRYLLELMTGAADRSAFFVCALALVLDQNRHVLVQETVRGEITEAPAGAGGFGYDPLFFLPAHGCTVAELPDPIKDRLSHRGKAGARLRPILDQLARENP
jgi:XTP/dITP diphosphohydrolase